MQNFKDFMTEGVYDRHIFKAFFLAGGPGSGKSWVSKRTLEGSGMKVINTDAGLENYAKRAKLDLERMDRFTDDETKLKDYLRDKSKRGTKKVLEYAVRGRLGLILDSTARDTDRIEREQRAFESVGYDTYCVFVNTKIEIALKRNQNVDRGRPVPEHIVRKNWNIVQKNRAILMRMFGSNYVEVDNNEDLEYINNQTFKAINRLKSSKYMKVAAQKWVANELEMKRLAGMKK